MRKGFAVNPTQEAAIVAYGLSPKGVYLRGRNKEDIDDALTALRDGGELLIAGDLRIFGSKRKEILAITDRIEAAGIKIVDVRKPTASLSKLIDCALSKTAGDARKKGAGVSVKKAGKKGGKRKGVVQELRRAAIAHEDVVRRICEAPELSWRRRAEILGPPFSTGTLRRRYT